jgi:hypothetical protein
MKQIFSNLAVVAAIILLAAGCGGSDQGVVINGVKWAKCNVDAPGTFAASPESAGMFYQWNRKTGWSSADPLVNSDGGTQWNRNTSSATEWAAENDPSPAGWRIPTVKELQSLLEKDKVTNEWTTQNGVEGRRFTDKTSGKSIFFPVTGGRYSDNGKLFSEMHKSPNGSGTYHSSQADEGGMYYGSKGMDFNSKKVTCTNIISDGFCIRSVAISENELSKK